MVKPSRRREMARHYVEAGRMTVKSACLAFGISQTCDRYQAKLNAENEVIADWLVRLTTNQRNWGFGLVFPLPAERKGLRLESQARLSNLSRAGAEALPLCRSRGLNCL